MKDAAYVPPPSTSPYTTHTLSRVILYLCCHALNTEVPYGCVYCSYQNQGTHTQGSIQRPAVNALVGFYCVVVSAAHVPTKSHAI